MDIHKIRNLLLFLFALTFVFASPASAINATESAVTNGGSNYTQKGFPSFKSTTETSSSLAATAQTPICQFGACFYYVGASQTGFSATGAAVTITQAKPIVGANDYHSLTELAVRSADGKQIVEVGWIVAKDINGDSAPHLFVYHWVNGQTSCYNACGFVPLPGAITAAGATIPAGVTGRFKINHANNKWIITYNGNQVGHFPDSLWGGTFTKANDVHVFGEVASSATTQPKTQMGNGILGSSANSAEMSRFALIGSTTIASLTPYVIGNSSVYNFGRATALGLRYGGPGY